MTKYCIDVKGKQHEWSFDLGHKNPSYVKLWREDGLRVYEIVNMIPEWVPTWAIKLWCWIEDHW